MLNGFLKTKKLNHLIGLLLFLSGKRKLRMVVIALIIIHLHFNF